MFLHRHDKDTISTSKTSLSSLREANRKRARAWREGAGLNTFPEHVVSGFAQKTSDSEEVATKKSHERIDDNSGNVDREQGLDDGSKTQNDEANSYGKHITDQDNIVQPGIVTLLDILPSFIHLSATRMAMGSITSEPESIPDTYEDSVDLSDDTASGDTLSWATEPQWLQLAASFMLQAILERRLDLIPSPANDASHVLEAFAWGYIDTPSDTAKDSTARLRTDKSLTIPDSDEGDITALGTTPTSSPTALLPSHSDIFILRTEKTPQEAGKAWRTLRLQAMSLLVPDVGDSTSLQEHMMKLRLHHPVPAFVKDLLGFLSGLFCSVEEPVLVQLERVWPAWVAARNDRGNRHGTLEDEVDMVCDGKDDIVGWLREAGEKVTVGGNDLRETEVEALMALVNDLWT